MSTAPQPQPFDPLAVPPDGDFPARWAIAWGMDRFGYWQAFAIEGVRQVMRWIPPGTFLMGSPEDEPERFDDETQHEVTLTRGFWLGETTVTQALWQALAGENPSRFGDDPDCPVEQVSGEDCVAWIDRANDRLDGFLLRLPTDAEWEYACRAGTTTPFHFGESLSPDQANYDGNFPYAGGEKGVSRGRTVPALAFEANRWGLYQMHGNVWEWCGDGSRAYSSRAVDDPTGPEDGPTRVLRGGSWLDRGRRLRSAQRLGYDPGLRNDFFGFRLAGGSPSR